MSTKVLRIVNKNYVIYRSTTGVEVRHDISSPKTFHDKTFHNKMFYYYLPDRPFLRTPETPGGDAKHERVGTTTVFVVRLHF